MMKEMQNKYNNIQSVLNVQENKINTLNTKFEEILLNQNKILEMLEKNNIQKIREKYLLRSKKRLKIFISFFSLIFIVYYFNIIDFVLNCYYYYYYYSDLFKQILDFSQSAEIIQSNIQQLNQNYHQLLEKMNTNQEFLERMEANKQLLNRIDKKTVSTNYSPYLKPSYFSFK